MSFSYVKSPCVMVCNQDDNDICTGCFRSGKEIDEWNFYSDDEKRSVLKNTYRRYNEIHHGKDSKPEWDGRPKPAVKSESNA